MYYYVITTKFGKMQTRESRRKLTDWFCRRRRRLQPALPSPHPGLLANIHNKHHRQSRPRPLHRERKCADTIGTVLVPSAARLFQWRNINIGVYVSNKIHGSSFINQHSETVVVWNYPDADCSLKKNTLILLFIIIFGTLSFPTAQPIKMEFTA